MGRRLTLILGGARSGKSDYAQARARKRGGDKVLFVATAQAKDGEMEARIAAHRAGRPSSWNTIEAPRSIAEHLRSAPDVSMVILDCVTLWVSNVLLDGKEHAEAAMMAELAELMDWYRAADVELILVSNEVGMGVVPPNELGRLYRDLLGAVNRRIAADADEVLWLIAGLPVDLKALAKPWEEE